MNSPVWVAFSNNVQAKASMVIRDFNCASVGTAPFEAYSVLIVDSNAVLSLPVTVQFLQPVSRRDLQVVQRQGTVEHGQLSFRHAGRRRAPCLARSPDLRRFLVGESLDHRAIITTNVNNVKR